MSKTASTKTKSRIYGFDALRAFSALYIMGIWHLRNYIDPDLSDSLKTHILSQIVFYSLAAFTFISGFLITRHQEDSVKCFLINRVLRIYPLYLAALIGMYLTHYINKRQLLLSVFGLGCFYPKHSPLTLWYINMIILFYLITIILFKLKNDSYRLFISIMIEGILYILACQLEIDERLYFYFPFFVAGYFYAEHSNLLENLENAKTRILLFIGIDMACIFMLVAHFTPKEFTYATLIGSLAFIVCGVALGSACCRFSVFRTIIMFFSYASMAIYMFHRPIYYLAKKVAGTLKFPTTLIVIVIIILFSYCIQFVYDKVISTLLSKHQQ